MTFPLSDMVSLNLTIAAGGLRAANLSTPCLIGYHTAWVDYVRTFYSASSVVASGIASGSPLHKMAQAAFAQTPSPRSVKIGRRATPPVHAVELTPTTDAVGNTITVTIHAPDGTSRTYSQACAGGGVNAEATALAVLINADVAGYGAAGTTELLVAAAAPPIVTIDPGAGAAAGQIFWYSGLSNLEFLDVTPDPGLAADLVLIQADDDDWYAACLDSQSKAEQTILVDELDVQGKSVWVASMDTEVADGTAANLFDALNTASYTRAVPIWVPGDLSAYPAVAAAAKMLTFKPGATILANQTLSGVTAAVNGETLSEAQLINIRGDRGNAYIEFGGVNCIDPQAGYCSYERYVDERLTLDYLAANIPVELANAIQALVSGGSKVPYTDAAAAIARGAIRKVLELAESWGAVMLRDGETNYFTFSATPAAAQTAADKAARIFRGCEFSCVITGAAQQFPLDGTLTFV